VISTEDSVDPFRCDDYGNSEFSLAILEGKVELAKKYLKEKNIDEYEDLRNLLNYPNPEFYSYIASNVCYKKSKSNLNILLGLAYYDIGSKCLFAEAKESYMKCLD
jgi:hypothetical protein